MQTQLLSQPCRNFQILGIGSFTDPRDHREKVVLSNFAAGGTGNLVIVDPATGEGEDISLPGDSGAWAVLNWQDEKLLIGTCGTYGYLHCLDLASREWAEPLRDEEETYIWNLCIGSDGLVYGGTYPGCVLLQYDPAAHRLENVGRMSQNSANLYSRMVYGGVPGHILVSCGTADPHLSLWNMESGKAHRFGKEGAAVRGVGEGFFCTQTGDEIDTYDSTSFECLESDREDQLIAEPSPPNRYGGMRMHKHLTDGRWLVNRGQEYYIDDGEEDAPILQPIPAERPATHILTITADDAGNIWGAAGFGQTIFRYNPATDESWNSQVVTDNSGEVYGMAWTAERLFLATYSGGDHVVYDPTVPWQQLDNSNPVTLESVSPGLIRPSGKSVVGPDGHVWTGWMAAYGIYGGGISKIDVNTLAMTCWRDPVAQQAVMGLTADTRCLYFITGGSANGLASRNVTPHFVVWETDGTIRTTHVFEMGTQLTGLAVTAERVVIIAEDQVYVYDSQSDRLEAPITLPAPASYAAGLPDGRVALFGEDQMWLLSPEAGDLGPGCDMPGRVGSLAVSPDGEVFVAIGAQLNRLTL
ncbi:MAG: hypothetical protein HN712_01890 [Gemmatimonadetes bacterium]|jgi:hypothetical protein|nr:hypothetical protein [Gemmatimonadota bacterium]